MDEKGQQGVELMILLSIVMFVLIVIILLVVYYSDMHSDLRERWNLRGECTKIVNQLTMVKSYGSGMSSRVFTLDYNTTFYVDQHFVYLESESDYAYCVYPEMPVRNSDENATFSFDELSTIRFLNVESEVVVSLVE